MTTARSAVRETKAAIRERAQAIVAALAAEYGAPRCELDHQSPLELLVATILSAQCTDARVNLVTPALFASHRTAADYAHSPPGALERLIRSTGFFNAKANNLRGCGRALVERHGGAVPRTMEELVALPGVARKTANVVLGTAYGIASGVVVDTHVQRITRLLRLTRADDPVKVERDLVALLPQAEWIAFSHRLIRHGRTTCIARRPKCDRCCLAALCPSARRAEPVRPTGAPAAPALKKSRRAKVR